MSLLGRDKRTMKSWKAAPEEMSLEATAKDGQWRCWRDVLRKTVLDTRGGDRKSSVTDGWQPHTANSQWRCRGGTQVTSSFGVCWLGVATYSAEALPRMHLNSPFSDKKSTNFLAECVHLTVTVSEIERDIYEKIVILSYPLHSTPPLGGFPSEHRHPLWDEKTRMVSLPDGKKLWGR